MRGITIHSCSPSGVLNAGQTVEGVDKRKSGTRGATLRNKFSGVQLEESPTICVILERICLPFFKPLKKIRNFEWTTECQDSFEALKEYLSSALNSVLIQEQDSKQLPIYYVSKVLQGAKLQYSNTEKLAFALLIAARKLRP
ncbi:hypothetical protein RJ639_035463 [Escallonia herrerae]|uniref:Reverse transcriptase RNase H-like domain-containing protein n=1 Tax=Escallonia herrerae TaxID=1293975 RepID=A0AA88X3B3_9ASTE|nr:hypothetical protein RJ639_035463 [Escallonia herrerae]